MNACGAAPKRLLPTIDVPEYSPITNFLGGVGDHVGILGDATLLKRIEDWVSPRIV